MSEQRSSLRIGDLAADFELDSTQGPIHFYEDTKDKWAILLAHPNRNPVSTTEMVMFSLREWEFTNRNVKVIALAPGAVSEHRKWCAEMKKTLQTDINIPIAADTARKVSLAYDMVDTTNSKGVSHTVRGIFIIDPNKEIRLIFSYPTSIGANTAEVLRVVDALQTSDASKIMTPANWFPGQDVILNPEIGKAQAEDEYSDVKVINPILKIAAMTIEETTVPLSPTKDSGQVLGGMPDSFSAPATRG